ncbi:integral membrane protein [Cladophialophora carrionii]|uniref:Integral membrane protein n=1 Tax=Cladophialophora carrionii TaxID=86049 RepID=A0A1C1C875_9EURO|nr:integral membrane protein [Cladophialophora carrionii]
MPVISRILSVGLRACQIAFAGVVAGIVGSYLHDYHDGNGWPLARLIYIEVVAGISLLLGLLWLLPFSGGFFHWPMDILLSFAWFASFGLLVEWLGDSTCNGDTFDWNQISFHGFCGRYRSAEAFSFLSAIFWLLSAIVGLWFIHRDGRKKTTVVAPAGEGA